MIKMINAILPFVFGFELSVVVAAVDAGKLGGI
jgi:hypothetical protein